MSDRNIFLGSLSPLVAVMQSADPGQFNDFAALVRPGPDVQMVCPFQAYNEFYRYDNI
ncbi:hypothetical protein N9934_01470 [Desulfosarcina sp.]|nr:hypothetical protein [Desulfosarcina sp.]